MARCRRRTQWLSVGLLGASSALAAPPATSEPPREPPKQAETKPAAPDPALLLYLSEFEDAQGEWIDPADLPPPDADAAAEDDDDAP